MVWMTLIVQLQKIFGTGDLHLNQLDNYAAGQIPDITLHVHVHSIIWKFLFNFRLIYLFTEIIKVKYFC